MKPVPLRKSGVVLAMALLPYATFAAQPETVTVGYQKANIFALLKSRGILDHSFKEKGITVRWVEFPAGPQMLEGLNVGSIDLAATGDAPPAFAQAAKADLVYLGHSPANPKTEAVVVPESSSVKNMKDLKGKRVVLNKGSDVNFLLIKALEEAGLSYKDITPVYLPPADARAAFQKGAVDAWVIWDPYLAEVEAHAGARQIRNAENLVSHYTFYLASRKFAETYPDTAKQVLVKLSELSEWANSNQNEAAAILAKSTGLENSIWRTTIARLPYGAQRMSPGVYQQQQQLADTFTRVGLIPAKIDVRTATWSLDK